MRKKEWELGRLEGVVVVILVSFVIAALAMHYWKPSAEAAESAVKVERQVVRARASDSARVNPPATRVANAASNWKLVPAPKPVSQYERSANKFGLTLTGTRAMTIAVTTATANR